jgi:hypothetical protein
VRKKYPNTQKAKIKTKKSKMTTEFITEFMDLLVQKHGYDKEVLQGTWQSVTKTPKKVKEASASKPKKEKVLCSYMFEEGKKMGELCGVWVRNPTNCNYCTKHTPDKLEAQKLSKLYDQLVYGVCEIRRKRVFNKLDYESLTLSYKAGIGPIIYRSDKKIYDEFKSNVAEFISTILREEFDKFITNNRRTFIKVGNDEWSIPKIFYQGWTDCMSEHFFKRNDNIEF